MSNEAANAFQIKIDVCAMRSVCTVERLIVTNNRIINLGERNGIKMSIDVSAANIMKSAFFNTN